MRNYLLNLRLWFNGFRRFGELQFKPGWSNDWRWKLLYTLDYGFCVIFMAGPVTSVSRYTEDHWFSSYHGAHTGPDLWSSVRSPPWVRVVVPVVWAILLARLIWGH
jgi:hypothetical protein